MDDARLKHLEFIQDVINRMNTNSFQIKGWAVTLVSILLAIFSSTKNEYVVLVAVFPAVVLWCLDAYYLMQERKFRGLYDDVAEVSKSPKEIKAFAMPLDLYIGGRYSLANSFRSTTIVALYFSMSVSLVGFFVYLHCWK